MSVVEILNLVALFIVAGTTGTVAANLIKQMVLPDGVKCIMALAVCGAIGIAEAYLGGEFGLLASSWGEMTADQIVLAATVAMAGGTAAYHLYFKGQPFMMKLEQMLQVAKPPVE